MSRPQNHRKKVGNEVAGGRSRVLDLRAWVQPAIARTEEIAVRVVAPPVQVVLKPLSVTNTPRETSFDGFAYDLLFITTAAGVSLVTEYRDWLFLAYLVVAVVLQESSQRIFRSAIVCLVFIPVTQMLHREVLADSFAIFTFYFLCIGTFRAIIESMVSERNERKGKNL